ncbi:MAG TPA: hypothetical protein VFQ89_01505, partial [Candidatus Binatia bacterium]|nr:hypothetical protein [Candidatus Binatia bacterium]
NARREIFVATRAERTRIFVSAGFGAQKRPPIRRKTRRDKNYCNISNLAGWVPGLEPENVALS